MLNHAPGTLSKEAGHAPSAETEPSNLSPRPLFSLSSLPVTTFFSLEQQQDALHGGGRLLDALCGVGSRLLVLGIMHCAAATISCCQPRPAAAAAEDLPRTLLISLHANLTQTLCF